MKIIEKINKIKEIKENIKTSIENKGIDTTNKKFEEYPTLIDSISTGGSDDKDYSISNGAYLCYFIDNQNVIDFLCKNLKETNTNYYYTFYNTIGKIPYSFKFNKKYNSSSNSSYICPFGNKYYCYNLEHTFENLNTKNNTLVLNLYENIPVYGYDSFYYCNSPSLIINNKNNEIWIANGYSCFSNSYFKELPTLNVEKCVNCGSMFQNSKVEKIIFKGRIGIENDDNSKYKYFEGGTKQTLYNMFYNCSNLTSIKNLDLTNIYKTINNNNMFYNCNNLKELSFEGTENLQINLDVSSTGLEREGLLNMLDTLPKLNESITLKIGTTKMNLLTDEDIANFTLKGYTLA